MGCKITANRAECGSLQSAPSLMVSLSNHASRFCQFRRDYWL